MKLFDRLFRRPAPPVPREAPEAAEFLDVLTAPLLPHRTPGLFAARRHTWDAVHHALGAIRATDAWADARHDPARGSAADLLHLAALQQIDTALDALGEARALLPRPDTEEGPR